MSLPYRPLLAQALALLASLALFVSSARAQESPGQADLDAATETRVTGESLSDLEKTIELAESAIAKGLDDDNKAIAKELLDGALLEHAKRLSDAIFENPTPQWQALRRRAMRSLDKLAKNSPEIAPAKLMAAKLQLLPQGDREKAKGALAEAIAQAKDDRETLVEAYGLRGLLSAEADNKGEALADVVSMVAIEPDPAKTEAPLRDVVSRLRPFAETIERLGEIIDASKDPARKAIATWVRGRILLAERKTDEAVADFTAAIESRPGFAQALVVRGQTLGAQGKTAEALADATKAVEAMPKYAEARMLRGRLLWADEKFDDALVDANAAVESFPEDERALRKLPGGAKDLADALLLRSQIQLSMGKTEEAKADAEAARKLNPERDALSSVKLEIALQQRKFGEALSILKSMSEEDPENARVRLQMALVCVADKRPRMAIEIFTEILSTEAENVDAIRGRGDAFLSIGKHKEAVADFAEAHRLAPKDSGVLNNYAWVLATSPDDDVRDAAKAIELGIQACEATEYKRPHILSTLAAGYAEKGDWDKAIEWSSKAVELGAGEEDVGDQLKKELENYKDKKPWRERQETEENSEPLDLEA